MSNFIEIDSDNVWPETIEIPMTGDFSAISDERGPSVRFVDGDDITTLANLPKDLFDALQKNPTWSRAIGTALDRTYHRGRDSGLEDGAEGVQSNIRRALGLS